MINFDYIAKITSKTLTRDHTFFSNPNKHKKWSTDKLSLQPQKITDVNFQCIGYGQFYVQSIIQRFTQYIKDCIIDLVNLKNLRLKINGFDLKQCPKLIENVCEMIDKLPRQSMKLFEIQTTKLVNCDMEKDFGELFKNALRLGIKERHGVIKPENSFETLILQFADWQFMYKGQKCQPNPQLFKKHLWIVEDEAFNTDGYSFKKFRLELSTWYYTQKQTQIFFHSYKPSQFHSQVQTFVKSCYNNMPQLQYFQMDLRNWHNKFQLSSLRDILMMIPKQGAKNMSINSKNIGKSKRKRSNNQNQILMQRGGDSDDDVILFERHIVI